MKNIVINIATVVMILFMALVSFTAGRMYQKAHWVNTVWSTFGNQQQSFTAACFESADMVVNEIEYVVEEVLSSF